MRVINLYGGPGTGKSTTAAHLFAELKQRDVNCELVREYAKDIVWEGRISLLENQIYIFAKQLKRQLDLADKVDFLITDSPLLLTLIYCDDTDLHALALREFNKFDNLNFLLMRSKIYNTAGRVQTEEEAQALDGRIEDMLSVNNIGGWAIPADDRAATTIRRDFLHIE